jgi:hypothetical protein
MSRKQCMGDVLIWIFFVADAMIWIAVDEGMEEFYAVACSLLEDFLTQGGSTSSENGKNSVSFTVTVSDTLIYAHLKKVLHYEYLLHSSN